MPLLALLLPTAASVVSAPPRALAPISGSAYALGFDFGTKVVSAFRLLQRGNNVGKVVVSIANLRTKERLFRSDLVTGGTSGLGLVTARWLAHGGAGTLLLASRSATVAASDKAGFDLMQSAVMIARANASERADMARLISMAMGVAPALVGVWHAAGVLADGMLAQQNADSLRRVWGTWTSRSGVARGVVDP